MSSLEREKDYRTQFQRTLFCCESRFWKGHIIILVKKNRKNEQFWMRLFSE